MSILNALRNEYYLHNIQNELFTGNIPHFYTIFIINKTVLKLLLYSIYGCT